MQFYSAKRPRTNTNKSLYIATCKRKENKKKTLIQNSFLFPYKYCMMFENN